MKRYWWIIPVALFSFISFCVAASNGKHSQLKTTEEDPPTNIPTSHTSEMKPSDVAQYTTSCTTISGCQIMLIRLGYDVGLTGADGIYGPATYAAMNKCYKDHKCLYPAWELPTGYVAPPTTVYTSPSYNSDWARTCPDGSCYGTVSPSSGSPKTHYVHSYDRSDGTHVGGYYRGHK